MPGREVDRLALRVAERPDLAAQRRALGPGGTVASGSAPGSAMRRQIGRPPQAPGPYPYPYPYPYPLTTTPIRAEGTGAEGGESGESGVESYNPEQKERAP